MPEDVAPSGFIRQSASVCFRDATLFIPTRDRPRSLRGVLSFIQTFYGDIVRIVIADGSSAENQELLNKYISECQLTVSHLRFSDDIGFFDRVISGIESLESSCVVMGSDDDFPLLHRLLKCEDRLLTNESAMCALGSSVKFSFGLASTVKCRLSVARNITQPAAGERAEVYSRWPFPTTYGVSRTRHVLSRYVWLRKIIKPGYFDYCAGLFDAWSGSILAMPYTTFVCTSNFTHSYWRPESKRAWSERDDIKELVLGVASYMASTQPKAASSAEDLAADLLLQQFRRRLGDWPELRPNFRLSNDFAELAVQDQLFEFEEMIRLGCDSRGRLGRELTFIRDVVEGVIESESLGHLAGNYSQL